MTKEYAAIQLLRLGPLNLGEFEAITGWNYECCVGTIRRLRNKSKVRLLVRGAGKNHRSVYEAVQ